MGYRFQLEALKRYRQFQEESCQRDFSDAQRLHERESQTLMNLIAQRNHTEAERGVEADPARTGARLAMVATYLERLARQINAQRRVLMEAQHRCEEKRQVLIAAMQKRKTLDKLKEHGLKAYLANLNREEEKFINEMAINRHILNTK
jgi:flagellar FliJ protein